MDGDRLTPYEYYSEEVENEMYKLEGYLKEVNESLDAKHLDMQTSMFLTGRADWFDTTFADMRLNSFKTLFYQSTFLSCYFVFEAMFKKFCRLVEEQEKCRFSIKDMGSNDTITNCKNYIEKAANVRLVDSKIKWSDIVSYKKFRDTLTHRNEYNVIDNPDKGMITFLEGKDGITRKDNAFYISSDVFVNEFVMTFTLYLSNISHIVDMSKRSGMH